MFESMPSFFVPMAVGWRVGALGLIAVVGAITTALLYYDIASNEDHLGKESFKASFTTVLGAFEAFMFGQLRGARAIADSISTFASLPSVDVLLRIERVYTKMFQTSFGGMGIVARVNNTPSAVAAWEAACSARYNRTIVSYSIPPFSDVNDEFLWIMQDPMPLTENSAVFIGMHVASYEASRNMILQFTPRDEPPPQASFMMGVPIYGAQVAVSSLMTFMDVTGDDASVGVLTATTVFDHDPTQYLITTATTFDGVVKQVKDMSAHAVLVIQDHTGIETTAGGCAITDSVQVLSRSLSMTPTTSWTISIGQCPKFKDAFVTWRRYVVLSVCLATTALAITMCLFVMAFQNKVMEQALERMREHEKFNAHQQVVSYICHELRNPLHIIKTSFRAIVESCYTKTLVLLNASLMSETGDGADEGVFGSGATELEALSTEDVDSVVRDAQAALQQMQTTVNEVLDFRAIETGVASLKMNKELVKLSEAIRPVLLRCRAFLPRGVEFKLVLCDPDATVLVDRMRLGQILTNGLRYSSSSLFPSLPLPIHIMACAGDFRSNAGKFTLKGEVQVTVGVVTQLRSVRTYPRRRIVSGGKPRTVSKSPRIANAITSLYERVEKYMRQQSTDSSATTVDDHTQYICITISNSRAKEPMPRPEDCFIPFKQKSAGKAWRLLTAPESHIDLMRNIWLTSMDLSEDVQPEMLPELRSQRSGAVKVTTGLGLPLCRGFAHACGGWLALDESLPDGMTHFWCVIPSEIPRRRDEVVSSTASLITARLNDNLDDRPVSALQLTSQRHRDAVMPVDSASSHDTAVESSSSVPPSTQHSPEEHTGVMALQGIATSSSQRNVPVAPGKQAVKKFEKAVAVPPLAPKPALTIPADPVAVVDFGKLRVVVVDDEPANQRVARRFLLKHGVAPQNLVVLSDGKEIVALLARSSLISLLLFFDCTGSQALDYMMGRNALPLAHLPSSDSGVLPTPTTGATTPLHLPQVDVMLLDIRMPGKTGLEVMREHVPLPPYPIVAMTGNVDVDSVAEYKAVGFAGCLGKPFGSRSIKHAIEQALKGEWFSLIMNE